MSQAAASDVRPLRILFSMRNYWYVRHFAPVIRGLAERGHAVHLLAERAVNDQANDWSDAAEALVATVPGVSFSTAPRADVDVWYDLRTIVRLGLDYLRFTSPEYRPLTQMVARARQRTPRWLRSAAESTLGRSHGGRAVLSALLTRAERVMPPDPALADEIAGFDPDVLAITPLIELGSEQTDVVRIARELGVPSVLCAGSWDHLSSKGLIRAMPDRVVVWNDTQKREAMTMHGVPEAAIEVTGAQVFDAWFNRAPTLDRQAFCAKVGLDAARPFVLYACSALFEGSPSEADLIGRWITAVRATPGLGDIGILVRPHPKRATELAGAEWLDAPGIALWPKLATAPTSDDAKADYFDSLFHAAAVIGLNTSALIEGGIAGRPVLTILEPAYQGSQEGTLHFRYLLEGGLLRASRTIADHIPQLAAAVRVPHGTRVNDPFVMAFVRPHGLATAATPLVIEALETAADLVVVEQPETVGDRLMRAALRPLARTTYNRFAEQVGRARRRRIKDEESARWREKMAPVRARRRAEAAAERTRIREARDARRARERAEAIARREAEKQGRVAAAEAARLAEKAVILAQREEAKREEKARKVRAKAERMEQYKREKREAARKS